MGIDPLLLLQPEASTHEKELREALEKRVPIEKIVPFEDVKSKINSLHVTEEEKSHLFQVACRLTL